MLKQNSSPKNLNSIFYSPSCSNLYVTLSSEKHKRRYFEMKNVHLFFSISLHSYSCNTARQFNDFTLCLFSPASSFFDCKSYRYNVRVIVMFHEGRDIPCVWLWLVAGQSEATQWPTGEHYRTGDVEDASTSVHMSRAGLE